MTLREYIEAKNAAVAWEHISLNLAFQAMVEWLQQRVDSIEERLARLEGADE